MANSDFCTDRAEALDPKTDLSDRNKREDIRDFLRRSITKGDEYRNTYRAHGYPIEAELMDRLVVFHHADDSKTYELAVHDLKLIRRFLLQRYAFRLARLVDKRLAGKVSPLWLWKDYFIPRIGLSLVIGFGGAMGSSTIFEWLAGLKGAAATLFAQACLLVVFLLVYLNVRDVVTGSHPNVWGRSVWVFAVALGWVGIGLLLAAGLDHLMGWGFDWRHGTLTGCTALVLAVLTQFFFTKAGSMAEPL
jgi:hypothetical protein